jgi:hypothetical protein
VAGGCFQKHIPWIAVFIRLFLGFYNDPPCIMGRSTRFPLWLLEKKNLTLINITDFETITAHSTILTVSSENSIM